MDTTLAILAILIAAGTLWHSIHYAGKNEKRLNSSELAQQELENKSVRLEADLMFEKVRVKKEEFELAIAELIVSSENEKSLFLSAITKYSSLFNEIEAFSTRLNDETIPVNDYVKKEVIPLFIKMAKYQVTSFGTLNDTAKKLGLKPLKSPDYGSFSNFNSILLNHSNKYAEIKELRKKVRLHI